MNTQQTSRLLAAGGSIIVGLLLILGLLLWLSSPLRPVRGFFTAVEGQKKDAALGYITENAAQNIKDDVNFFVDDWMTAGKAGIEIEKTDSFNTVTEGDKTTLDPTPKYWAHQTRVFVNVSFEEFDDPVMFTLERKSGGNGMLKNLFRGWKIAAIEYQPIGEDVVDGEEVDVEPILEDTTTDGEADATENNATTNTNATEEETVDVDGDQEDPGTIEQ